MHLRDVGFIEMIIAMMPILGSYNIGKVYFHLLVPILLTVIAITRKVASKSTYNYKYLKWFSAFLILHDIVLMFILPSIPSYYVNLLLSFIIIAVAIYNVPNVVDYRKLIGSISLVAVICVIGMFYQAVWARIEGTVQPIPIPILVDFVDKTSRIFKYNDRLVSFFLEPQAYVSYIIVPLFFALQEKKLVWAAVMVISILLSGSTTGIVMIVVILFTYGFTQKNSIWIRLLVMALLVGAAYFLQNSIYAESGLDKLNSTKYNENIRLVNGVFIALSMDFSDFLFGISYANPTDYYMHSGKMLTGVIPDGEGFVFVPAFWYCFIRCGIVGLLLYLRFFFNFIKDNKKIFPLWICLVVSLFSNPDFFGMGFLFQMIVIIVYNSHCIKDIK